MFMPIPSASNPTQTIAERIAGCASVSPVYAIHFSTWCEEFKGQKVVKRPGKHIFETPQYNIFRLQHPS
jgi:hypothetical protein